MILSIPDIVEMEASPIIKSCLTTRTVLPAVARIVGLSVVLDVEQQQLLDFLKVILRWSTDEEVRIDVHNNMVRLGLEYCQLALQRL